MDESVANFVGITGANEAAAHQVLEMCAGDLEQAVQLWFADEELQRNLMSATASISAAPATPSTSANRSSGSAAASRSQRPRQARPNASSREDARGVVHIDDSDENMEMSDEEPPDLGEDDDDHMIQQATQVARSAQEEEDAAMAARLQNEVYSSAPTDEDGVRAPMGRTTETLIGPGPMGMDPNDIDDDNAHAFMLEQFRRRQQQQAQVRTPNPFAQSVWDGNGPRLPGQSARQNHLADLFRPPYDLMSSLTWDEARDAGKQQKRWLLVNLQNPSDFHCQALNRDHWKDEAIKQLVQEHFIFLQYAKGLPNATSYIAFYFADQSHESSKTYPHVAIIDPRTGEMVKVWSGLPFPKPLELHAQLAEFLDRYSLEANSKNPVVKTKQPKPAKDIDRMTEEEMLEMALQASMNPNGESSSKSTVIDPDALTKASEPSSVDKGKAKEELEATEEHQAGNTAFKAISSSKPHTEPTTDPATTTRIQFRHPTGRVIRRFAQDDRVLRVYEWLKAEPLEGKEGVEFELKVMPQGHDLIEDLDKTITEAGLKQGTVMIEFL